MEHSEMVVINDEYYVPFSGDEKMVEELEALNTDIIVDVNNQVVFVKVL